MLAIHGARPGAMIGYVGVPHGVTLEGHEMFFLQRGMLGSPAPVRRFLPHLIGPSAHTPDPSLQSVRPCPAAGDVAKGYRAMDQRRALKTIRPGRRIPSHVAPAIHCSSR
jgi:hypothetical protein